MTSRDAEGATGTESGRRPYWQGTSRTDSDPVRLRDLWMHVRWWIRCKRKGYPAGVYRTVSPEPPPPKALERLRKRVLSGDWESPDVE